MNFALPGFYCMLFILSTTAGNLPRTTPSITLQDHSKVIGTVINDPICNQTVWQFLGISYAQPPINDLRFKRPLSVMPWSGILNATSFSNACMQRTSGMKMDIWNPPIWTGISEDCLYLNIWVPTKLSQVNRNSSLTVMVWIHGGGYFSGTSSEPGTEGTILAAKENVIVVSMNYRLSIFGFAYAGIDEAPGNMGLFDQMEALKWIKNNIVYFGGDPDRVTIFGVSAGGASTSLHLLSSLSRQYFNRAIVQSGAASDHWAVTNSTKLIEQMLNAAKKLQCYSPDSPGSVQNENDWKKIVHCMRNRSADEIVVLFDGLEDEAMMVTWTPVVDGYFLTEDPIEALRFGHFNNHTDILIGSVANEGSIFLYPLFPQVFQLLLGDQIDLSAEMLKDLVSKSIYFKYRTPHVLNATLDIYGTNDLLSSNAASNVSISRALILEKILGDAHFTCGIEYFAQQNAKFGQKVYRYAFTYKRPEIKIPWLQCHHGIDMHFPFGKYLREGNQSPQSQIEAALSEKIMRFWANFARTGNPNTNPDGTMTQIKWPEYGVQQQLHIELDGNLYAHKAGYNKRKCNFWNEFVPKKKDDSGHVEIHLQ